MTQDTGAGIKDLCVWILDRLEHSVMVVFPQSVQIDGK